MSAPELCPAHRHDRPEDAEERVLCVREPHLDGAWGFICYSCWEALEDARARRIEWELD